MKKVFCAGFVVLLLLPAALLAAPGEGIGGVDVGIRKRPGGQPAGSARTDASGAFAIGNLEAGSYTLVVSIPGGHRDPAPDNAKSYFESRSNTVRQGAELVLQFQGWPYALAIAPAGITTREGTIAEVTPSARSRAAQGDFTGVRIELDVEVTGPEKTLGGVVRTKLEATKGRSSSPAAASR